MPLPMKNVWLHWAEQWDYMQIFYVNQRREVAEDWEIVKQVLWSASQFEASSRLKWLKPPGQIMSFFCGENHKKIQSKNLLEATGRVWGVKEFSRGWELLTCHSVHSFHVLLSQRWTLFPSCIPHRPLSDSGLSVNVCHSSPVLLRCVIPNELSCVGLLHIEDCLCSLTAYSWPARSTNRFIGSISNKNLCLANTEVCDSLSEFGVIQVLD